mmetsp:Transcript_21786/g.53859  ORF Transcript_21786/g.53859 Transcript_21786/m.53859 type:complete len:212 (-) Transcript_21786:107-742(-)
MESALSTWIFGLDAKFRELWARSLTEDSSLVGKDLPLITKRGQIIDASRTVSGKSLSSFVVSKKTDRTSKDGFVSNEFDTDKLLVNLHNNGCIVIQVNHVFTFVGRGNHVGNGKASKGVKISLVVVVDPIMFLVILGVGRTFNLKSILANLDGNALDVGPVINHLGTNVNLQTKSICEQIIFHHDKVTLAIKLVMLVVPGDDICVATSTGW